MDAKRWNQLIRAVNDGDKADSITPELSGEERKIFAEMELELAEMRAKNPKAAFSPVENEY